MDVWTALLLGLAAGAIGTVIFTAIEYADIALTKRPPHGLGRGRPPEKPLLAFPPHAAAVKFDVVPPTGAHAGELYVALFGDEVPMTAPSGPRVGRSIARVDTASWALHPLALGPARRPIDVRIDAAAAWVYVLDFGQFEMTDTGVDVEAGIGALWRFKLPTEGAG